MRARRATSRPGALGSAPSRALVEQARAQGSAQHPRFAVRRAAGEQKPLDEYWRHGPATGLATAARAGRRRATSSASSCEARPVRARPWGVSERHARRLGVMMWDEPARAARAEFAAPLADAVSTASSDAREIGATRTTPGGPVRDSDQTASRVTVYGMHAR